MNERWVVVETTTRRGKRWHIRFQAGNGESVVHGENLESRDAAHRAILSVARAHSLTGEAWLEQATATTPGRPDQVVIGGGTAFDRVYVPIVSLTEQPKRSRWSRRA
jgi:uncharacterized protein YegP (UPF0339 family)